MIIIKVRKITLTSFHHTKSCSIGFNLSARLGPAGSRSALPCLVFLGCSGAVDYSELLHLVHSFLCFVLSMQLDLRSFKNRKCHTDIGTTWAIVLYFWNLVILFKHTDNSILKSLLIVSLLSQLLCFLNFTSLPATGDNYLDHLSTYNIY